MQSDLYPCGGCCWWNKGRSQFPAKVFGESLSATSSSCIRPPASGARQAWLNHSATSWTLGSQDSRSCSCWTNVYLSREVHSFLRPSSSQGPLLFGPLPGSLFCSPGVFPIKWKKLHTSSPSCTPAALLLYPQYFSCFNSKF